MIVEPIGGLPCSPPSAGEAIENAVPGWSNGGRKVVDPAAIPGDPPTKLKLNDAGAFQNDGLDAENCGLAFVQLENDPNVEPLPETA